MIYLIYLALVPISLVLTLIAIILAPVMPVLAGQQFGWCDNHSYEGFGPRLPTWLSWFQTPDNSLDGDATFERINGKGYWSQVKWLWRNPCYAFTLHYINTINNPTSFTGDDTIKDNDNAKAGWVFVHCAGLFQFTWVQPIGFSRCIYCNLGWNIRGTMHQPANTLYQATFVFSPRISGFR